jgi:hypothetical protein
MIGSRLIDLFEPPPCSTLCASRDVYDWMPFSCRSIPENTISIPFPFAASHDPQALPPCLFRYRLSTRRPTFGDFSSCVNIGRMILDRVSQSCVGSLCSPLDHDRSFGMSLSQGIRDLQFTPRCDETGRARSSSPPQAQPFGARADSQVTVIASDDAARTWQTQMAFPHEVSLNANHLESISLRS